MIRTMVALALASVVVGGQAQAAPAKARPAATKAAPAYRAPRGPDGKHPDLNGVWQVMNTANYNIEPHASSAAMQMRPGPVVPVPAKDVVALGAVGSVPAGLGVVEGGTIPYKPDALKQRDANKADWIHKDPEIKCYLPGVPRANYMALPFQIFQSESATLFAYEYAGAVRNIMFKDPGPAPVDSWMGQSVGHWEGDTLVVVVTGMNDFDLVRPGRQLPHRRHEGRRALHAHRSRRDALRGRDHRSGDLHPALEDEHEPLQARRRGRAPAAVQVRRVRRGIDVWSPAQRAAQVIIVKQGPIVSIAVGGAI